ncbi:MAG TPA: hypothetical protein VM754_09635 [Actinomycetota bacterium]|nr:hypothetical protein [Actinomycetota bacterium]
MDITDDRGRALNEVTVRLTPEEVTDLLVAASDLEGDGAEHAMLRSPDGTTLAVYRSTDEPTPLQRGTDWWVGPLVLVAVILVVVGAYTIGRGLVDLFL